MQKRRVKPYWESEVIPSTGSCELGQSGLKISTFPFEQEWDWNWEIYPTPPCVCKELS